MMNDYLHHLLHRPESPKCQWPLANRVALRNPFKWNWALSNQLNRPKNSLLLRHSATMTATMKSKKCRPNVGCEWGTLDGRFIEVHCWCLCLGYCIWLASFQNRYRPFRDTPTSSGPNSFGKTKKGFCDAKKIFEKNLREINYDWGAHHSPTRIHTHWHTHRDIIRDEYHSSILYWQHWHRFDSMPNIQLNFLCQFHKIRHSSKFDGLQWNS